MSGWSRGIFEFSRLGGATPGRGCSIIWQEDYDERQFHSRGSMGESWGQELISDDRVYSVRVPRG